MTQAPQIRAACYCRISSDPKDKREGVTRQQEDTAALCELKGWKIAGLYIDNDRSASNGKGRPEWDRLLADVEAGKIDAVAAWDQDRVNRMMDDFQRYKRLFVERGILLATSNNGDIDLSTPAGVLTATIKTAVSEHEVSMMKIRMRRAGRQRAEIGTPKWTTTPFGYTDDHQPHPVEAELVRKGYETILGGGSLAGLAREWNRQGYYGRNGKPWTASTLSLFLRKPRNTGLRSHNGVVVGPGTWTPIVDESTWRATQALLDDPARKPGPKTVRRHFLTGVLRCGKCGDGGRVTGYQGPRGQQRYRCGKCFGVAVSKPEADEFIRGLVCARLARPDAKELLIDRDTPDIDKLTGEANTLRARITELGTAFADGDLTASQVRVATQRLQDKLGDVEIRMASASAKLVFADVPLGTDRVHEVFTRLDLDRQRAIVDAILVATVMPVGKRGRVPFDPERIAIEWRQ
ncbi:serine recombinase [Mycobacterium marinum]|uniref:recombinase family protein n=1 Tax=Mycobacterium marinum TaxID=1781 RepID=UPI0021C4C58E|nr:recombinase family protein [Mycobacterium marinum]GJO36598.1 serine recombinase [Mycobacterium marinum]